MRQLMQKMVFIQAAKLQTNDRWIPLRYGVGGCALIIKVNMSRALFTYYSFMAGRQSLRRYVGYESFISFSYYI
jgi:hypothetical protein